MSVRRRINRHRSEPCGYDYADVLKKGKAFHRISEEFEMSPFEASKGTMWMACSRTTPPFKPSEGTRIYKFDRSQKKWIEIT